ncbi:hypothetical protein CH337_15245 [Rhodoblastus acidophilus]|nr:hypothetical protein CKO16_19580 [Rhodoblastus acidophilus]RAI17985.1 hypothetical protein CH337_15245 [Rhodoblastus acidophilus]
MFVERRVRKQLRQISRVANELAKIATIGILSKLGNQFVATRCEGIFEVSAKGNDSIVYVHLRDGAGEILPWFRVLGIVLERVENKLNNGAQARTLGNAYNMITIALR